MIKHHPKFKKMISTKVFRLIIFLLVFIFTFILRAHGYERVPTANHLDEMLYAWSGLYLVETGVPTSWSTLDYPKRAEVYSGRISYKGGVPETYVTLYKPWLDEPPLFSLIVGWSAHLQGAIKEDFVPSSFIRFPMVIFAAITSILIFLVARAVSGYWIGVLSMLIYGTIPLLVFASRTAMPENFIAMLLMLTIYILLKFSSTLKFWYLVPIPIISGLAGLAKPTGYFILPLTIFWIFHVLRPKKTNLAIKYSLFLLLGILPFVGIFFAYGLYFDPEIFWRIISIQGHRPAGFNSLAWFFISPSYSTSIFRDSWYTFSLIVAAFFLFTNQAGIKKMISLSFVYWVIIVMLSGGENDLLAWYRFPSFPLLAILSAWGLQYLVKKADFFASFLAAGFLLGNRMLLVNPFHPNVSPMQYRLIFSGLLAPSLLGWLFEKKWMEHISRLLIVGIIVAGVYLNVRYIYNAFDIECQSISCPIVPTTKLSSLYLPFIWRFLIINAPIGQ